MCFLDEMYGPEPPECNNNYFQQGSKCEKKGKPLHICPFKIEIFTTEKQGELCACCDDCEVTCAMEI